MLEGHKSLHVVKGKELFGDFFAGCKQQRIISSGQLNRFMALSEGQRKILDIIADLTGRTLSTSTMDAVVIDKSGLPEEEVRNYLGQLDGLGYITIGIKVSGADYRMINMTKEGLQITSDNQSLR
jgi:hypothetical protein